VKHALKLISADRSASDPALKAEGLRKTFQVGQIRHTVLDDIFLEAAAGEFVCLLGPSGCGKTTLLKIIAGFIPADGGTIHVQGLPVGKPGSDRCMVFQEDALFPWLTVQENIAFGLKNRFYNKKAAGEQVDRFLELVGLNAHRHHLPAEISGGMKQRAALARVLILKPRILLMDEPFGALDAQTREAMQILLLNIWQQLAHTILFVTHDIAEAMTLADRILVMDQQPGRIRSQITVPLARPRKKESEAFHRFYRHMREQLRRPS
jgi:NitT/TauT family transport system ATP-binding protein